MIRLTDAQLAVLERLWEEGPQTIRVLTASLYPTQSTSDYATVQKLLEQLEAKECVTRDRTGTAHVFSASVERGEIITDQLQQMAERLCGGSLSSVLLHLVEGAKLSKRDRAALRRLLDESESTKRGRSNDR